MTPCGCCYNQRCITRRERWVLTDVDTCIWARTSCTLSSLELAASAGGRECNQRCDQVSACGVWYAPLKWVHFAVAGNELRWYSARQRLDELGKLANIAVIAPQAFAINTHIGSSSSDNKHRLHCYIYIRQRASTTTGRIDHGPLYTSTIEVHGSTSVGVGRGSFPVTICYQTNRGPYEITNYLHQLSRTIWPVLQSLQPHGRRGPPIIIYVIM